MRVQSLKERAAKLKVETLALYFAARDPRTPWCAKLLIAGIVGYAVSPIDLIPDFLPLIGFLDDLIIIPIGIALAIKLIPNPVLAECRVRAHQSLQSGLPGSRAAAAVIIAIWLILAGLCGFWAYKIFG